MILSDKIKIRLWKFIYPIFVPIRNALLSLGILNHSGRQPFLLGVLAHDKTAEQFRKHMETRGFHNHFVAWNDDKQLLSMRKIGGTSHQYHIRLFEDREIRGHFEFTPETHPIEHLFDYKLQAKTADFLHFLGEWVELNPVEDRSKTK